MKRNRVNFLEKLLCGIFLGAGLMLCAGCSRTVQYTSTNTAMGTMVHQTVYTSGKDVTPAITALLTDLEQDTLSWRLETSEVAAINAAAGTEEGIPLSEEMAQALAVLLEVSERSNGAFDITMHPVVRFWNIDAWAAGEAQQSDVPQQESALEAQPSDSTEQSAVLSGEATVSLPTPSEIDVALSHTGYEALTLTGNQLYLPADMSLDLGAAGKGIACDRIAEYFAQTGVNGAVISVGGSVLTYGNKSDKTPWQVGVVDPQDTSKLLGTLTLSGTHFVSTSGDYERYVEIDGVRYHHILNPATGYPADSGLSSVTIVCDSGILSDALSTACFVLGVEDGMELAESYGAEALFVDENGKIYMTEDMQGIFKETGEK